jgi:hypothetical protein
MKMAGMTFRCPSCGEEIEAAMDFKADVTKITIDTHQGEVERLTAVLTKIADSDPSEWVDCSARQTAAVALGREPKDINRALMAPKS